MSTSDTTGARPASRDAEDEAALVHRIQGMISKVRFANVYVLNLWAERTRVGDAESFHVRIEPKYLVHSDRLDYLYTASCTPFSQDKEDVAHVQVSYVATYDAVDGFDPRAEDTAVVEGFGHQVALYAVYPYIREAIQSLGGRLDLTNMTMDLIRRDEPLPEGLSIGTADDSQTGAEG